MKKTTFIQAGFFALLIGTAPFAFAGGGGGPDVTDESCARQFYSSTANNTCTARSVESDGDNCTVLADCKKTRSKGWRYTYATVSFKDTGELRNCDGHLRKLFDSLYYKGCVK